ncbi:MAG: autotransporter-associated beta strand repeat-containing protein [Verrucomicrobia bacterium]|nr:autotransporter-associated beta strand repeat-containing protein [Verrucomicrobiota bacterium]
MGASTYNVWHRNTVTSDEQVVTGVTSPYTISGLTNGTPYEFKVSATNFIATSDYSDIVTETPTVSTACDMLTFVFPGLPDAIISYPDISLTVPTGTDVTALAPTFTVSPNAAASPVSGTSLNFTGTQSYTVTAEDGITTKTYQVTVTEGAVPSIFTWTDPVTGNWSDSSKWTNDLATGSKPVAAGQPYYALNFTQPGTYTTTNDLSDGFLLNQLNFGGAVTLAGTNSLALTTNDTTLPTVKQNSASGVAIDTPVSLAAEVTVGGTGSGQVTLAGLVSGTGGLTKDTSGVLQLYGLVPNTYSGGTIINSGTLHLGAYINGISPYCVNPAGTGPVTLNGGTIRFDRVSAANALIVYGGTLYSQNGWGATWSGPITLNATLTCNAVYGLTYSGAISGIGGLTKTSGGPLILSVNNGYTGPTTVTGGTLECKALDALGSGALSISTGATVNLNYSGTKTIASLTLGGVAKLAAGTYGSIASGADFQSDVYFVGTGKVAVVSSTPQAYITAFGTDVTGSNAVIGEPVGGTANIAWIVPPGTDLATVAPTFTMSSDAMCSDQASGATPVPGFEAGPVVYTVVSSDTLITNFYTVTATVLPAPPGGTSASPMCWYDAGNGVTATGGAVSVWNDISGYAHHATPGGGSVTLAANQVGSLPAVLLRSGGFMDCAVAMPKIVKEQYVVLRSPNTTWSGGSFLGRKSNDFLTVRSSSYNMAGGTTGFWQDHFPLAVSKNGTPLPATGPCSTGGNPPHFCLDPITEYMLLKIVVDDQATAANLAQYPFYQIGKNEGTGTTDFDVAEIIGFGSTLSPADEALLNAYLTAKYFAAASGYAAWAALYAADGAANEDANNDGVQNGIAYFMGENGLTTNPGIVDGKVRWKKAVTDAYTVKVSTDLQSWGDAPGDSVTEEVTGSDTYVVFTLPKTGPILFGRLVVVIP